MLAQISSGTTAAQGALSHSCPGWFPSASSCTDGRLGLPALPLQLGPPGGEGGDLGGKEGLKVFLGAGGVSTSTQCPAGVDPNSSEEVVNGAGGIPASVPRRLPAPLAAAVVPARRSEHPDQHVCSLGKQLMRFPRQAHKRDVSSHGAWTA